MTDGRPPRPDALAVEADAVPDTLRERPSWVCWRYQFDSDRDEWTKVPVDATTGALAKSTDSDTWTDFETVLSYHRERGTDTDGVGYVVHNADAVVGIDLDDCRDATGEIADWARDVLDAVTTYAEVSPSGTGLRLFGLGFVPDGGNRGDVPDTEGHVEMYDTARYLTVTGHHIEDNPGTVEQVNDAVDTVHSQYIADDGPDSGDETPTSGADKRRSPDLTDTELIELARNAENGGKFRQLWNGNTSGYPSHSEADLALCSLLAFWTGGDRHEIDHLFRQSDLYREKWDRDDYRRRTLDKALSGVTEYYDPDATRDTTSQRDGGAGGHEDAGDVTTLFIEACERYSIDSGRVATVVHDGDKVPVWGQFSLTTPT
jgi:primase-polymerase (primpol)-like protein